jgi:hypothetical protein
MDKRWPLKKDNKEINNFFAFFFMQIREARVPRRIPTTRNISRKFMKI